MEIMHRLQQSICIAIGVGAFTSISTSIAAGVGRGTSATDGLVRFRNRIYVSNCSELKKLILREFHAKPNSRHPGYHKT